MAIKFLSDRDQDIPEAQSTSLVGPVAPLQSLHPAILLPKHRKITRPHPYSKKEEDTMWRVIFLMCSRIERSGGVSWQVEKRLTHSNQHDPSFTKDWLTQLNKCPQFWEVSLIATFAMVQRGIVAQFFETLDQPVTPLR